MIGSGTHKQLGIIRYKVQEGVNNEASVWLGQRGDETKQILGYLAVSVSEA